MFQTGASVHTLLRCMFWYICAAEHVCLWPSACILLFYGGPHSQFILFLWPCEASSLHAVRLDALSGVCTLVCVLEHVK